MAKAVSSAELCGIFCTVGVDVIYVVLAAGVWCRYRYHTVLGALLR